MLERGHDPAVHVSEQQVIAHAQHLAVILLNSVTLVASISALLLPNTPESNLGLVALALLVCWSVYRLVTRSRSTTFQILDLCYVMVVSASVPVFGTDPQLLYTNSVPQVIAGVAVITCAIAQPPRGVSCPCDHSGLHCRVRAGRRVGSEVLHIPMLYYMLAVEWRGHDGPVC